MKMEGLLDALDAVRVASEARLEACRLAWEVLKKVDPLLAEEISSFWPNDDVAAGWVFSPHSGGLTPAEMVAAGRSELVRSIIRQSEHGFCA